MSGASMPSVTLVRSVDVGGAIEQGRVFVEYVPGNLVDLLCKAIRHAAGVGASEDDVAADQSLDDAIVNAQRVGARLLAYVVPQNLLFIFGESGQALLQLPLETVSGNALTDLALSPSQYADKQQAQTKQEPDADSRAIVLCQVGNAQALRHLVGRKDDDAEHQAQCYQVAWSELQKLKQWLDDVAHQQSVCQGGAA